MKHSIIKVFVYLSFVAIVGLVTGCKDDVFQVNDVVSDPGAFSKPLTLEGVVYAHAQGDTSIVGVMDKKELQCTTPNCNKALLAVKAPGQQLSVGDEIKASGTIVKESWGYVLKADDVKVVTKHKIGA
ncbi:MAG: hypothetical protein JRE16_08210 [Deltaproteobacteria bacterium]|jgi:hypothetical protein|nr:hypothetical protein [Deltaproteobacteria bacterium]MBW2504537.1 hypothetical protein [Deltaproteobacteria bacterium]MBW2520279.1 hypothetical protein [Deltaproteobacteria bacterium]